MQTPCIVCGRLVRAGTGGRCREHRTPPRLIRSGARWRRLSTAVRKEGKCWWCGRWVGSVNLDAHHLLTVAERPDLAYAVHNLRPVCKSCHRTLHQSAYNGP